MEPYSQSSRLGTRHLSFIALLLLPVLLSGQTVFEQLIVRSPTPTPNHINNLQYGNGKFLATTDTAGVIISSDDGINWSTHQTGYWGSISDVAYGNGIYFVTSAGSGPAYFSSDLETWTQVSSSNLPTNNDNVYFHDGSFYFGGAQWDDNPGISTTADGVTFTDVATPGDSDVEDIIFANGQFLTVGRDLEIMTSPDGVNWTVRPTGITIEGLGAGLLNVRYLNSLYVAGGKANYILTSPDGITWTQRAFSEDSSWFWDSWFDGTTYYFPGRSRTLWTTTDFSSWTGIQLSGEINEDVYNIVNAEGITVVTGRRGLIYSSTNQVTWTSRKSGFSNTFNSVAYGAGLFVASYNDAVYNSADGITWTESSPPGLNDNWVNVIYEDGKFVIMNNDGQWSLSIDGQIWSAVSAEPDPFSRVNKFRFLNGKWFVVGANGLIRSSSSLVNMSDWDVHDVANDEFLYDISYGNGVYAAVGLDGLLYSSLDGSVWTQRDTDTDKDLWEIEFGHGKFVVLGTQGTVFTSTDGISWTQDGQDGQPFVFGDLVFRDGQFVCLSSQGRVYYSSDGLSWTNVRAPVTEFMEGSAQSDDTLVVVGRSGLIMSADLPPKKSLTVNIEGQGEVEISPDGSPYPHLAQVTLIPVAGEDYAFSVWSGDVSSDENPLILEMDADKTITANFVLSVSGFRLWVYQHFNEAERADENISGEDADPDVDGLTNLEEYELGTDPNEKNGPHTLVVNVIGDGSVELSPAGGGPYTYGTEVTVTATGTTEFAFTSWSGDATGNSHPLVVTMDADKTINANFSLDLDGFALFRYTQFSPEERIEEDIAGPQADYDLDGLSNLEEYLLNTDPKVADFGKSLRMGTVKIGSQEYLTITYNRSKDIIGISQIVEVGSDLDSWQSGGAFSEEYDVQDNGDGTEAVTMRVLDPIGSLPSWFVRIIFSEES